MTALSLTKEDYELLIDAVDRWPARGQAGEMLGDMMVSMLAGPEEKEHLKAEMKKRREEARRQQKEDEEIATLLKSKLILLRQAL